MSCEVLCTLSSLLNIVFSTSEVCLHCIHDCWTRELWLSSLQAEPAWVRTAMTREFSKGLLTLCACTDLHTAQGAYRLMWETCLAVVQTPSIPKRSRLPLGCYDSLKLHFPSPKFLPCFQSPFCWQQSLTEGWKGKFSAGLYFGWFEKIVKPDSVKVCPIDQIWFGLLHLLHRSVCISEVSVMLLDVIVS